MTSVAAEVQQVGLRGDARQAANGKVTKVVDEMWTYLCRNMKTFYKCSLASRTLLWDCTGCSQWVGTSVQGNGEAFT